MKSPTTYFVMVLMTVRVLPFFLTVVLIRSVTLFVSTLGVRSYSDQRYSSMQISSTRHSSGVSTVRTAGFGYVVHRLRREQGHEPHACFRRRRRTRIEQRRLDRRAISAAETLARTKAVSAGPDQPPPPPTDMAAGAIRGLGVRL